ncbi:MAG TPA: leucyl aminopeptidase [Ktedonobacteraceae bacterium]|nr:leucyl aminopeptidase [Ktedonobacteraceae bacterium]
MDFQIASKAVKDVACDALVVGAARAKKAGQDAKEVVLSETAKAVDTVLGGLITRICADGEFKGSLGEMATVYTMGKLAARRVVVVGLGTLEALNAQALRKASAIAARHLQQTGAHQIALALSWEDAAIEAESGAQAQVEGTLLGLYTFKKYQKSDDNGNGSGITKTWLISSGKANQNTLEQGIRRGSALAEAANFARDLVNEPPNVLTPTELANRANTMAKQSGLECEILDRPQMQELGMGGLLGVAQGSAEPPKFIILRYHGAPKSSEKGMALVGKGITFDSGGISLKPGEGMEKMKGDMAGAAAVIGAMQAIAALKPKVNVTALVSTTENMPSGTAYRPGDILRIMNGKTIEIVNTDAEGRLVLADALSYAAKEGLSPIIDVATLTGAVVVALGNTMAGVFSNDAQLTDEIIAAGKSAGEKFWPMPMDEEYGEQIKSEVADIKQTGGRGAGSVTAAKILEHFVGDAKWAHLDIAGTSFVDSKKPHQEMGATGMAVRTLAELAVRMGK